jgi:hypothetical protein
VEEKWTIDKLDGANWITWKFQLRHFMAARDLWKHVEGSAVIPPNATAEQRVN